MKLEVHHVLVARNKWALDCAPNKSGAVVDFMLKAGHAKRTWDEVTCGECIKAGRPYPVPEPPRKP